MVGLTRLLAVFISYGGKKGSAVRITGDDTRAGCELVIDIPYTKRKINRIYLYSCAPID